MDFHDFCPYSLSPSHFSFFYFLKLLGLLSPALSAKLLKPLFRCTPALTFPPPIPFGTHSLRNPFPSGFGLCCSIIKVTDSFQLAKSSTACQKPSFLTSHHRPSWSVCPWPPRLPHTLTSLATLLTLLCWCLWGLERSSLDLESHPVPWLLGPTHSVTATCLRPRPLPYTPYAHAHSAVCRHHSLTRPSYSPELVPLPVLRPCSVSHTPSR